MPHLYVHLSPGCGPGFLISSLKGSSKLSASPLPFPLLPLLPFNAKDREDCEGQVSRKRGGEMASMNSLHQEQKQSKKKKNLSIKMSFSIPSCRAPPQALLGGITELRERKFNVTTNFSIYCQMSLLNDFSSDCPNISVFHYRSLDTCHIFPKALVDFPNGFIPLYLFILIVPNLLSKLILSG